MTGKRLAVYGAAASVLLLGIAVRLELDLRAIHRARHAGAVASPPAGVRESPSPTLNHRQLHRELLGASEEAVRRRLGEPVSMSVWPPPEVGYVTAMQLHDELTLAGLSPPPDVLWTYQNLTRDLVTGKPEPFTSIRFHEGKVVAVMLGP
jgi:hypothetical protein